MLIDTGAAVSCLSESTFHDIKGHLNFQAVPMTPNFRITEASGSAIDIVGHYQLQFITNLLNKPRKCYEFLFFIIRGLSLPRILGMDFIRHYNIIIKDREIILPDLEQPHIKVKKDITIPGIFFGTIEVDCINFEGNKDYWMEQTQCSVEKYQIFGGFINDQQCKKHVMIFNSQVDAVELLKGDHIEN